MINSVSETCKLKIGNFEGPFDLLFHLIEKNKVNIWDIHIAEITDQYMDYLFAMQKMDMEVASEFLVMAATLLHIKSKMLLPSKNEEKAESEEAADPREELAVKLIEYKKYKEISLYLRELDLKWSMAFYRPSGIYNKAYNGLYKMYGSEFETSNDNLVVSPETLKNVYQALLKKNSEKSNNRSVDIKQIIQKSKETLRSKMKQIQQLLLSKGRFIFTEIFSPAKKSVSEVVTAFLALLILVKTGNASVEQEKLFSDIIVERIKKSKKNLTLS